MSGPPQKEAGPPQGPATTMDCAAVNDREHEHLQNTTSTITSQGLGQNGRRSPEHLAYLRSQLRRFLERRGVQIAADGTMRCVNPEHPDEHPSAHCYEERVTCFVCSVSWDVFSVCGLLDGIPDYKSTFVLRIEAVEQTLGVSPQVIPAELPKKRERVKQSSPLVALPLEEARSRYGAAQAWMLTTAKRFNWGDRIAGSWTCKDPEGRVELLAVRFEGGSRSKNVITFWWDGEHVRCKHPPVRLFGRDLLAASPELPVAIHFGEKCWEAAKAIAGWVPVTWNGGEKKARYVDWQPLAGREVVVFPDDDLPGRQTAAYLRQALAPICKSLRVLAPLEEARKIKARGADIVEALDVRTPEQIAEYLRSGPELAEVIRPAAVPATAEDIRPQIVANERDLREIAAESIAALVRRNRPPRLFRRGAEIIRIVDGRIESMSEAAMRHELANAAAFVEEKRTGRLAPCPPPKEVVQDIPTWEKIQLPELVRIVHGPTFDENGTLLTDAGYHEEAKILIRNPLSVPEFGGSGAEAGQWLARELFHDFPFAMVDVQQQPVKADEANAMAALLTCCARDMIQGNIPMFGVEAPTPGSGKGLLVDAVTAAAFGPGGAEIASYSENEEEMRKHITASLRGSPNAIKLDNVKSRIDSAVLSSMITAPIWSDRILGRSEKIYLPVRAVVFSTGNNPTLSGEIARRYIRIRLVPLEEKPWNRTGFRHDPLCEWILEHRAEILAAVACMIRAWIHLGRPSWSGRPLGSFENWSRTIGGILQACGVEGFMANHAELFEISDTEDEAWACLVSEWWKAFSSDVKTSAEIFLLARSIEGFPFRGSTDHAQQIAFGRSLGKQKDKVFDDIRVIRVPGKKHGASYQLLRGNVGNKGNVVTAPHAREDTDNKQELLEFHNVAQGCDIPFIPDIPHIPEIPAGGTSGDSGDSKSLFVPREREKQNNKLGIGNDVFSPPRPPALDVPADLLGLSPPDLEALTQALGDYMDGPPQRPECQPDYERLTAEISRRQEARL